MKRGFTLIEIMVVISIIGMLSSVLVAAVSPARAKARDSVRIQQVRQIDLAVQLYKASNNDKAPDLGTSCRAQIGSMLLNTVLSACVAVSTQGTGSGTAWGKLKTDLTPYMPVLPNDPCGTNCSSVYGNPLGYTYYPPIYFQATTCDTSCTQQQIDQLNQNYQLSAQLEGQNSQTGGSNAIPVVTLSASSNGEGYISITWSATNTFTTPTPCRFSVDPSGYDTSVGLKPNSGTITPEYELPSTIIFTCSGPGGTGTKTLSI